MNRIEDILLDLEITSAELANELGVTPSLIYMVSTGTRQLSDKLALAISHRFGYNKDWLFGNSDVKFVKKEDQILLTNVKTNLTRINQEEFTKRLMALATDLWLNKVVKNESEFCRKIGYEQSSWALIKSGKRLFPTSKIPTISDAFNVSTEWLMFGTGEKFKASQKENTVSEPSQIYGKTDKINDVGIPYYNVDVSASTGIQMFSDVKEMPSEKYIIPGFEDCDFAVPVFGHSMYPTYENGTIIMCKKIEDKSLIVFGEAYLIVTADYRMVKRLQRSDEIGHVLACSDNEENRIKSDKKKYEPVDIPIDKILFLYLVKGVIKRNQL